MAEASLIPKIEARGQVYLAEGVGAFFRIAFILFLAAAFLSGALYLYKIYLVKNLNSQKSVLKKLEIEFEPSLVEDLENIANAIFTAEEILRAHATPSSIFDLLEANTLAPVTFSSFSYAADKQSITLAGEARGYSDISAQSSIFEQLDAVESVAFSNLALKDAGSVGFNLNMVFKK